MDKIEILKVETKGTKFKVYTNVDNNPVTLTEDVIVNYKIFKNKIFSNSEWENILNNNIESSLFNKALNYINYKPRTNKEIVEYLNKLGASITNITNILDRLIKIKYIDDERYTSLFIEEGIRNYKGPILLINQLEKLGIEKEIIYSNISIYNKNIEYENAYNLICKYLKQIDKNPINKQKELIYQKLIRSGYNYEICTKVINNIEYNSDDLEKLEKLYIDLINKNLDETKIITKLISKGYKFDDIKKVTNKYK